MERNRQKLVGRDKGSLTEQQTKGTVTTTIQIRGIHKTNSKMQRVTLTARCPVRSRSVTLSRRPATPQEPSIAAHGMEYPALFGQVGSACPAVRLCPLLAPGEN